MANVFSIYSMKTPNNQRLSNIFRGMKWEHWPEMCLKTWSNLSFSLVPQSIFCVHLLAKRRLETSLIYPCGKKYFRLGQKEAWFLRKSLFLIKVLMTRSSAFISPGFWILLKNVYFPKELILATATFSPQYFLKVVVIRM